MWILGEVEGEGLGKVQAKRGAVKRLFFLKAFVRLLSEWLGWLVVSPVDGTGCEKQPKEAFSSGNPSLDMLSTCIGPGLPLWMLRLCASGPLGLWASGPRKGLSTVLLQLLSRTLGDTDPTPPPSNIAF